MHCDAVEGSVVIKAFLLDLDGTLVQSNEAHAKAWAEALNAYGFNVQHATVLEWIGMGGDKILPRVRGDLNEDAEPGASIVRLRGQIFLKEYARSLKPTAGARALLVRLGRASILRVIATSAKKDELAVVLDAAGLTSEIDLATTSDDAARSKPDADILESALRKANASASEAIYLGDTPYDIEAAHRSGMRVIALRSGGWDDRGLAGADAIYDDPADLLQRFDDSLIAQDERFKEQTR